MRILGISAYFHDSAAALVVNGDIVAAAEEERFTRIKHDASFPVHAVEYCLSEAGCGIEDIDYLVFYEKPLQKFDRLLETYLAHAPLGFRSFCKALPLWLKQKLLLPREMRRSLGGRYTGPIVFTEHHESHAASAFFPSPFEEAAILTVDGVGEWATTTIGKGKAKGIEILKEIHFPHSIGLLYSAFTSYLGFRVNSGEYKLMGLAPYGRPKFADRIRENLIDLKADGSFRLNMEYFNYGHGLTMTNDSFHDLFGDGPRKPESEITEFHMDIAASIQVVTEEIMLAMAEHAHELTGSQNLCLAGGVALNCVANGRLLRESPFERIWIQPAAGDAGAALGSALFTWHQLLEKPRKPTESDGQQGSLLGPAYADDEIRHFLETEGCIFSQIEDELKLSEEIARLIADQKVVGLHHGRMEFGPRALGARSILGDARSADMQELINRKIKFRESFRPFAPCVIKEQAADYFETDQESPYMLLVAPVKESRRTKPKDTPATGFGQLKEIRSEIPAVTHVDYSARIQTVDEERNPILHRIIRSFEKQTACPVMINTSFNVRGEPIVCTPQDAYHCFMATDMDVLILGSHVLHKDQQTESSHSDRQAHLAAFPLD